MIKLFCIISQRELSSQCKISWTQRNGLFVCLTNSLKDWAAQFMKYCFSYLLSLGPCSCGINSNKVRWRMKMSIYLRLNWNLLSMFKVTVRKITYLPSSIYHYPSPWSANIGKLIFSGCVKLSSTSYQGKEMIYWPWIGHTLSWSFKENYLRKYDPVTTEWHKF